MSRRDGRGEVEEWFWNGSKAGEQPERINYLPTFLLDSQFALKINRRGSIFLSSKEFLDHPRVQRLKIMSLGQVEPKPISERDDSTVYNTLTPPGTVADYDEGHNPTPGTGATSSSVPWPGSTFIIRSTTSGHVITVLDGKVTLAPPGGRGSIHWVCVETKGWIGFKNLVSGRYLGHNVEGKLCCSAAKQLGWENFCIRPRPDGGYLLQLTHFERLWTVGVKMEKGVEVLAKIEVGGPHEIITWEFIKV